MTIYIIHYLQEKGSFVVHSRPGSDKPEPIDHIILKDVVFFISPTVQEIIRERAKTQSRSDAKFPHAFAISTKREKNMKKSNDPSLLWEDFEYDVLIHNDFIISKTNEPISSTKVRYLMIRGKELKVVR